MEEILKETYGVTVYQEQVMLLSQKLAGFTKGDADTLRKAMGKKQREVLDKMKGKFIEGCTKNGHNIKICEKIWTDWEAFAHYAFNKSHSTCYAFVAYQTAYLKANYPAEYMSAVLTHNQGNIDKVSFFMDECRRMGIPVLGPDVNESDITFAVNDKGEIRFGLAAIKGIGEAAVIEIIRERKKNGAYLSLHDLTCRVNLRSVNKKSLEALVFAGAFDCFPLHRAQYFATGKNDVANVLESAIRYGSTYQDGVTSVKNSLFGDAVSIQITIPKIPDYPEWSAVEKLKKEFEVIGIYLSGHPLDDYRLELDAFKTCCLDELPKFLGKEICLVGYVISSEIKTSKNGEKFLIFNLGDYKTTIECALFGQSYLKFKSFVEEPGNVIYIKGKCQKSYRDPEKSEIRINEIELLSEVRSRKAMKLTLSIPLSGLSNGLLEMLKKVMHNSPGNDQMALKIVEDAEQFDVNFRSLNGCIKIEKSVVKDLEKIGEVSVKLV
jgi:DNA polymerase-3 subunit alpha